MSDDNDKEENDTPIIDKEILKVLKSQSEAMMNMNERIAKLEVLATQQQEVINKLIESIAIISDKN